MTCGGRDGEWLRTTRPGSAVTCATSCARGSHKSCSVAMELPAHAYMLRLPAVVSQLRLHVHPRLLPHFHPCFMFCNVVPDGSLSKPARNVCVGGNPGRTQSFFKFLPTGAQPAQALCVGTPRSRPQWATSAVGASRARMAATTTRTSS